MLLASLRVQLLALMLLGLYINLRVMALDPHMDQRLVFEVTSDAQAGETKGRGKREADRKLTG